MQDEIFMCKMMDTLATILQGNCCGLRTSKQEVVELIQTYKPCAVAIQEAKLWGNAAVKIAGYNSYNKQGHFNVTFYG